MVTSKPSIFKGKVQKQAVKEGAIDARKLFASKNGNHKILYLEYENGTVRYSDKKNRFDFTF